MPKRHGELAENRATDGISRLDVFDLARPFLLVPEIDTSSLKRRVHPGKKDGVLMGMIGWEVSRDFLPGGIEQRVDVSAAAKERLKPFGRFDDGMVISKDGPVTNAQQQMAPVVYACYRGRFARRLRATRKDVAPRLAGSERFADQPGNPWIVLRHALNRNIGPAVFPRQCEMLALAQRLGQSDHEGSSDPIVVAGKHFQHNALRRAIPGRLLQDGFRP